MLYLPVTVRTKVELDWSVRPNPEGRIIRKPEGQILNHKAKMIINGKAEFDRKAENLSNLIYACFIAIRPSGFGLMDQFVIV